MSKAEDSAIDAMVDEVMEGRDAKEAAVAPAADTSVHRQPEDIVVDEPAAAGGPSIGFAEGPEAAAAGETGDIASLQAERDSYLADSQRLAADFANYRKQSDKRVADAAAAQSAGLVRDLIPVLDACDAALLQDADSAAGPLRKQLLNELNKNGLELLSPEVDDVFDPEMHEAVMHEPAADDSPHDGPVIGEVLRAGYTWKDRVVRPAMVKVVG